MCLKRLITVLFERSVPFHLLRMMGVSVPCLHIESTDSMINTSISRHKSLYVFNYLLPMHDLLLLNSVYPLLQEQV